MSLLCTIRCRGRTDLVTLRLRQYHLREQMDPKLKPNWAVIHPLTRTVATPFTGLWLFRMNTRLVVSTLLWLTVPLSLSGCVKRSRAVDRAEQTPPRQPVRTQSNLIDINHAAANELETLPGIGRALALRIIEHREKYGPFRRSEHLIMVRGISDRRFRALRSLVTAG